MIGTAVESEMDNADVIGLQELTEDGVKESLENGNFYITLGPRLQVQIEQNGHIHHLGQELRAGDVQLQVRLESILREKCGISASKGKGGHQNEVIAEIDLKKISQGKFR